MVLTYESVYGFAETREVAVELIPLAAEYERTHFVGHAAWNPSLTVKQLMDYAETLESQIEARTGYRAFLVDIRIMQYAPVMTDVDFIIDVPVTPTLGFKKARFSPIDPLTLVAILAVCAAVYAWIIWLFWTTYVEKVKLYYCDQESPPSEYTGWEQYVAHLAEKHPTKYKAVQDAEAKNWWTEIPTMVKWIVGGAIAVSAILLVTAVVKG